MPVLTLPFAPSDSLSLWTILHARPRHGFFLGSGAAAENDHLIYFSAAEPVTLYQLNSFRPENAFQEMGKVIKRLRLTSNLPRIVGLLGFEAGRFFEMGLARLPQKPNPLKTPTFLFGDYPSVVQVDLKKQETTVSAQNFQELKRIQGVIIRSNKTPRSRAFRPSGRKFSHLSFTDFSKRITRTKKAIARGDIYQANLSIRFERAFSGDPVVLYRALCEKNPSPYAALMKMGPRWIVSCSPELLLSVEGRILRTRPIAGTRPRGLTAQKDRALKGQLLLSPKERAEHIMLVDLERNDLGRVSKPGSVRVTERFAIEPYSHVMHIVSEVQGLLRPGLSTLEAVKAIFPGGTITGCPKIAAVKMIEELEMKARGPFYGSIGYFAWNGDAKFNILIRTALIQNKKVFIQAGAGIVADSQPAREFRETLAKAQALLETINAVD